MFTRARPSVLALLLAAGSIACGSDTETASAASAAGGAGGSAPLCGDGGLGGGDGFLPTAADIAFSPLGAIPSGEQILFNDWSIPDTLKSMAPDGSSSVEIFRANRVWSFGVARAADKLAFSVGFPAAVQEQHYGLSLGDAIQHTWLYDFATQSISLLSYGNLNDECHQFGPGDHQLFVCRRYDFQDLGNNQYAFGGYRIGNICVSDQSFVWNSAEVEDELHLNPHPLPDTNELLFTRITIMGTTQSRAIVRMPLGGGTPELVRADASLQALSPDGQRMLYADHTQDGQLFTALVGGGDEIRVAAFRATSGRYSPAGDRVVFLVEDGAMPCQHVEIASSNGADATAPLRIRDCTQTGEFITALEWIDVP